MDTLVIDSLSTSFDKDTYIEKCYSDGNLSIELHYSSDFKNAKVLRDFIELIGKKVGLVNIDISRLVIVTDEMNNNSIEYGTKPGDINIMRVMCKGTPSLKNISIEVVDKGNGRKPRKAKEMDELRAFRAKHGYSRHSSIRGRGLFMIISSLVDKLYFKDSNEGGLVVGIKKTYMNKK